VSAAAVCCLLCFVLSVSGSDSTEDEVKKEDDYSTGPLSVLMQSVKQNTPVSGGHGRDGDGAHRIHPTRAVIACRRRLQSLASQHTLIRATDGAVQLLLDVERSCR
jgi:hypothetical protein